MAQELDGRLEAARRRLPEIAGEMVQVVVDNPGQFLVMGAGALVLTRMAANLMRPRTLLEAIALMITCQAAGTFLAVKAMENGLLQFRLRDADGKLLPAGILPGA
jgi:hypothetical protein